MPTNATLKRFKDQSLKVLKGFPADALILTGLEKHSRQPVTTLYIGNHHQFEFLTDVLYSHFDVVNSEKNNHMAKWMSQCFNPPRGIDLVACEFPSFLYPAFKKRPFLFVPNWVNLVIDLEKPWDDLFKNIGKKTRNEALRKIRKFNLSYGFSKKYSDFEIFFHDMLLPNIELRFGHQALTVHEEQVRAQFKQGELVQIHMGDEIIGMGLVFHDVRNRHFYFDKLGSNYASDRTIYDAANNGFYYFLLKEAHDRGCSILDLGSTRAMINDGIFLHKKRWGAEIRKPGVFQSNILVNPIHLDGGIRSIFQNNYFMVTEGPTYSCKWIVPPDQANADSIGSFYERIQMKGLDRFKIFSLEGFQERITSMKKNLPKNVGLFDLSRSPDPAKDFGRF